MILFIIGTIICLILIYLIIKSINKSQDESSIEGIQNRDEVMKYINSRTTKTLADINILEESKENIVSGSTNSSTNSLGLQSNYVEGFTIDCLDADEFVIGEYNNASKNSNPLNLSKPQQFQNCKKSEFAKWLGRCKKATSCSEIDQLNNDAPDGWECVYCVETNTFFSRNKQTGVKTNVCDQNMIATTTLKCEEKKAFKECGDLMSEGENKLTRCGKVPNNLNNKCGYCPTNNKILPMTVVGEGETAKYTPTYLDEGSGGSCAVYDVNTDTYNQMLIPTDKCELYMRNNPCLTSKFNSGPQSPECLQQLWKNTGCPDWITKDMGWKKWAYDMQKNKSRDELGVIPMKKWMKEETISKIKSNNYETSKKGYKACYGDDNVVFKKGEKLYKESFKQREIAGENAGIINPCDYKNSNGQYEPNEDCAKLIFKEVGCEIKNTPQNIGYNINKPEYKNIWKRNNRWKSKTNLEFTSDNGKGVSGGGKWATWLKENVLDTMTKAKTHKERADASKKCGIPTPPKPTPIKRGDTVLILNSNNPNIRLTGVVTKELAKRYQVMIVNVKIDGREYSRYSLESLLRKRDATIELNYFGWPTIPPKNKEIKKTFSITKFGIPKKYFDVYNKIKQCDNSGVCNNQYSIINRLNKRFPSPRACVYGPWKVDIDCPKKCIAYNNKNNKLNNRPSYYKTFKRDILSKGTMSEKCDETKLFKKEPCNNLKFCN